MSTEKRQASKKPRQKACASRGRAPGADVQETGGSGIILGGKLGTSGMERPVVEIHITHRPKEKSGNPPDLVGTSNMNLTLQINDVTLLGSIHHLSTVNRKRFMESNDAVYDKRHFTEVRHNSC